MSAGTPVDDRPLLDLPEEPRTNDAADIVGTGLTGGKELVTHAIIKTNVGPRLYCYPPNAADSIDLGPKAQVTCERCKRKLKAELTHG